MHHSPIMPFGRHRGEPIAAIPYDYLALLADSVDLRPPLAGHVAAELARRASAKTTTGNPPAHLPDLRPTLDIWRRRMATEFHPDRRGGSKEAMTAVNRGYDMLAQMLGGVK